MKKLTLIGLLLTGISQANIPINPGLAGTWHNNAVPGQGLFIDVIPEGQVLFAGWFTYVPDGADPHAPYWLTLQGVYQDSVAELSIFRTDNGLFNTATAVNNVQVGLGTLSFTSCTSAELTFQLDEFNLSDTIPLNRVTPDVSCADYVENSPPQLSQLNYPPSVTNVLVTEGEGGVRIEFDLADAEQDFLDLSFQALGPNNQVYEIPAAHLSGHVSYPVLTGERKSVVWHHTQDLGFQALGLAEVQIKVVADDRQYSTLQAIVDAVSEQRLMADIAALEGVRHHQFGPQGLATARNYIRQQMATGPIVMTEQPFNQIGATGINLIGTLPAQTDTNAVYIIDGHYDTVGGTPGADDNATGTAGMLEALRVLSQFNSQAHLKFIGFDQEELGLLGARFYANNKDPNEDIRGLLNFEMIGYTCRGQAECVNFPNADTSIYNIKSHFANTLSDTFMQVGATHVPELKITAVTDDGDFNFRRSDHAPFWDLGVDALFLTDGANFRTPHYHQSTDRLATLDTAFMTQVVKTAVGTVATLAGVNHQGAATSPSITLSND
ncbi:M28 family metallopeptidase [Marinicella meishanensis]|uniref:M28 family metallopeptidase n=1 Tax=Marinicella meishanensis TaxID=2873263 RepID=UPI001CBCF72F|nr:M28 family peptidase [Marinicella sp. NBU2979]